MAKREWVEQLELRRLLVGDFSYLVNFGEEEEIDIGQAVLTDLDGNTYLAASFRGRIDVDPRRNAAKRFLSFDDSDDILLAKYSPTGSLIWARQLGAEGEEQPLFLSLTPKGDLVMAGTYEGTANFGTKRRPVMVEEVGDRDIFVAVFDPSGRTLRATGFGGGNDDFPTALDVAPDGDIFLGGTVRLRADIDPRGSRANLIETVGVDDTFIMRLNPRNFAPRWSKVFGEDDTFENVEGLSAQADGSVIATGVIQNTVDFQRGSSRFTRESVGERDVYMARLTADGDWEYVNLIGGGEDDTIVDTFTGPDGDVYITGNFTDEADFAPGRGNRILTSLSESDAYVARYRANGRLVWARQLGGEDALIRAKALAVDGEGNVFAAGDFGETDEGPIDFDPGKGVQLVETDKDDPGRPISALGATDGYLVKLNDAGNFVYVRIFGGEDASLIVNDVSVDADGNPFITGAFNNLADFDPGPGQRLRQTLDDNEDADVFLVRLVD